jgi:hypothetical protein
MLQGKALQVPKIDAYASCAKNNDIDVKEGKEAARIIWRTDICRNSGNLRGNRRPLGYLIAACKNMSQGSARVVKDVDIAQSSAFGEQAQFNWYEAQANFSGDTKTVCVFCMRSLASGAALHCAYFQATQQALLEAHEFAFAWFGGVFARILYDNPRASVKNMCGVRQKQTERFIAFRSHCGFEAYFCDPVEVYNKATGRGEGGYFRRNDPSAVPRVRDLADLNQQLLLACQQDTQVTIGDRTETSHSLMLRERPHLHPLPRRRFDLAEISFPRVDRSSCVRVRTNRYSTPLKPGMQAEAKAHASYVEIWHNGRLVARHERCYKNQQQIFKLERHLEPPSSEPSALTTSTAVAA